jgi:hypothetical protein
MPVGPHILCAEATIQSAPMLRTSTGMFGTAWQQSSSSRAPTCRPAHASPRAPQASSDTQSAQTRLDLQTGNATERPRQAILHTKVHRMHMGTRPRSPTDAPGAPAPRRTPCPRCCRACWTRQRARRSSSSGSASASGPARTARSARRARRCRVRGRSIEGGLWLAAPQGRAPACPAPACRPSAGRGAAARPCAGRPAARAPGCCGAPPPTPAPARPARFSRLPTPPASPAPVKPV